jgi:SAM-dependent methyltransferase
MASFQDAYEALYTGKSYQHEIGLVDVLLDRRLPAGEPGEMPPRRRVLEVGCGPGLRLAVLLQWQGKYFAEGLDRDPGMVAIARRRLPDVLVHEGDVRDFSLPARYDAVLCLFGMIGYMATTDDLARAISRMGDHLAPGGVLLLEPWLSPELAQDGHLKADRAYRGSLVVQRMNYTRVVGNRTLLDVHYLIGDDQGVRHVQDMRALTLFSDAEYRAAFKQAGLGDVELEAYGPQGRGLYVVQR